MSDPKLRKELVLDEKWFLTPDMGEYLDNDMLLQAAKEMSDTVVDAEFAFETPFATSPGYYPTENVFVISGKPTFTYDAPGDDGLNSTDGDTIYLKYSDIVDDGKKYSWNNIKDLKTTLSVKEFIYHIAQLDSTDGKGRDCQIGIRLLGLNTPEIPHYNKFYNLKDNMEKVVTVNYADLYKAKTSTDRVMTSEGKSYPKAYFSYKKYNESNGKYTHRKNDEVIKFLQREGTAEINGIEEDIIAHYEILETTSEYWKVVTSHSAKGGDDADLEYCKQGILAQQKLKDLIKNAKEVIYIVDQSFISNKGDDRIPWDYRKEYEKISDRPMYAFTSLWKNLTLEGNTAYQQRGRRYFGQEVNGRFLGATYVKVDTSFGERWVNVGKSVLQEFDKVEALPSYNNTVEGDANYGFAADIFKLWSYEKSKQHYIDRLDDFRSEMGGDDRDKVQKDITGLDLSALTEHTVMIGDCLLMVPPTSIRVVSQTKSERVTLLRSKNSMTKSLPKSERILEMSLFFNGDEGINGIPYVQTTPNGKSITYHMNGLRSLIAQFKFTPFLPIHNAYLNYVLNIEAVSLVSYQVSTVPNYPRTLQVTIRLQEFDFRQYMPELLPPDPEQREDIFTNIFSKTIHFPVMRYYYQRSIMAGEVLSGIDFNSDEYMEKTLGQKTALQSMDFASPLFNVYVANEEHLKQRKQLKESLERNPIESVITFNDKEEAMLKSISTMFFNVKKAMASLHDTYQKLFTVNAEKGERVILYKDTSKDHIVYEKDFGKNPKGYMGIAHGTVVKIEHEQGELQDYNAITYVDTKSRKDIYETYMVEIRKKLIDAIYNNENFDGQKYIKDVNFAYKQVGSKASWEMGTFNLDFKWGIEIDIDWMAEGYKETLDKVKRMYAKSLNILVDDVFKDGKAFLAFTASFKKNQDTTANHILENTSYAYVDKNNDYKVLNSMSHSFQIVADDDGDIEKLPDDFFGTSSDLGDMKDNIDLESDKSIKYDLYPIGYPIINSMSFTYNNLFTSMSLKAIDGYASQYTGGSDTMIDISMTATDEFTVNQLNTLSRVCVQRMIDFRKIMASSPIRFDSELSRFMGINEVIIESIEINTVPNFPGTWDINMRLSSVDRTLRNREALKKIKNIDNYETKVDAVVKSKNFFEIKDALSKVELYPDLELPTISELENLGYYFLRYKDSGTRTFPDADFYFAYLHVYSSEMLRESIVNFFKESDNHKLYRQFSGDLFGEEQQVKYHLDNKANLNSKVDNSLIENITELDSYGKGKDLERMLEVLNQDSFKPNEFKEVEEATSELNKKVNEMNESVMAMREVISSSNFDSYEINPITKVSVKDASYFETENFNLQGKKKFRVYSRKEKFKVISSENKTKHMNESISELILDILSKEILFTKGTGENTQSDYPKFIPDNVGKITATSVKESIVYKDLFDYLVKDVGGHEGGYTNLMYSFKNGWNKKFDFQNNINIAMGAIGRGATAKVGIYDSDKSEDTSPRLYVTKTTYNKDGAKEEKKYPNVTYPMDGQGLSTLLLAEGKEELEKGIIFGPYGIKKYSPGMLMSIWGVQIPKASNGFLDPYYNKDLYVSIFGSEGTEEIDWVEREKQYIHNMINSLSFSENAFFRNMLVWLYKLLKEGQAFLPTPLYLMGEMNNILETAKDQDDEWYQNIGQWFKLNGFLGFGGVKNEVGKLEKQKEEGVFSSDQQRELIAKQTEQKLMETETQLEGEIEQMLKDVKEDLPRYRLSLLNGLFVTLGCLTLTEYDSPIYSAIKTGHIGTYAKYVDSIKGSFMSAQDLSETDMKVRKVFQYLDYQFDTKSKYEDLSYAGPMQKYSSQGKNQRVYLKAAEEPSLYLMHSFYDMVMTDMRGRMARAFPTYYMLLIDEGRDMGVWRLQDNFYDVSAITDFQVVKSRKIAADTAKITMTNLFGTFTTEDDDMKDEYQYTFKDMWNSIFSPYHYVSKEYTRRKEARDINRAKLKPGARVHLRMGYSGDASKLPIMFNGSVAEVVPGDLMTIVCQGDGVELANPSMFNPSDAKDVSDLKYNDSLISGFLGAFDNTTTPRDILLNPLIAEGTFIHELIKDFSKGRLFNANPFGIAHFGDKHFKEIFITNGEVEQNIYEALSKPSWGKNSATVDSAEYSYSLTSAPEIKVGLQGNRSYWDLMHIAASVSPDFISAIAPFQMRSTVFYGHPRYYYAYDYEKLSNNQIVEKRKPYQQYHIYTSYSDILSNTITASEKDVRTCAVGIYHAPGWAFGDKSKSVGPLYLDIDIFPEKQKMTTINCNFEYRNTNMLPFTIPVVDAAMSEISENGGYQIAWRATAMGLKDTVKDMYTGELVVMGDPSVKPYDKMFVYDIYEDMQGMAEVQTVVHSFSTETGFTTSITPDCISAIDNKYEQISHSVTKDILLPTLSTHLALCSMGSLYSKINRAFFFSASQSVKTFGDAAENVVASLGQLIGKEDVVKYSGVTDGLLSNAGIGFGVTATDYLIYSSLNKMSDAYEALGVTRKFEKASHLTTFIDDLLGFDKKLGDLSPDELIKHLESIDNPTDEVKAALEQAKIMKKSQQDALEFVNKISFSPDDLSKIAESARLNLDGSEISEALEKQISRIEQMANEGISLNPKSATYADDMAALRNTVGNVGAIDDDIAKIFKSIDDDIIKGAKATLKGYDDIKDSFKAVNAVRKGAGSIKAMVLSNVLWLAAELVITKSIQEFFERKLKNLQVLTVFPMMKNGKVYVAGIDGHKGSVFGSPTYSEPGFIEDMAIKFFEDKDGVLGWGFNMIRDLFITSDEMLKTVNNYKRENGFGLSSGQSREPQMIAEQQELMTQLAKSNVSGFNAYKKLYFDTRVSNMKTTDGKRAFEEYKFEDVSWNDLMFTRILEDNLVCIDEKNFELISLLKRKGVFKFAGEKDVKGSTDKSKYETSVLQIVDHVEGGIVRQVPCKIFESKNGNPPMISLPYVRPDAAVVLMMILEKVCETIQPDYKSANCTFEELSKHPIILHNGVRINDNGSKGSGSWFSTGFGFTLEVKNYSNFGNIIKDINKLDDDIAKTTQKGFKLTHFQKDAILAGETYNVLVTPKRLGN